MSSRSRADDGARRLRGRLRPRWFTTSRASWSRASSRAAPSARRTCAPIFRVSPRSSAASTTDAGGGDGTAFIFWVFHVIRDYAKTLKASPNPLAAERLAGLLDINEELEAAQVPLRVTFGHNDLLPANIIDDGSRLWLIDFEYAGFNTAMFDLANLASNASFSAAQSDDLLAAYFGREPNEDARMAHAAMQCASLLREALWSLVSEMYLGAPGADYDAYARRNFERFDTALAAYRARFGRGWPDAASLARAGRGHRGRHHRLLDGLSPGARP